MNLRDLQYLIAVADLRNFSQAANQCCVSQPTLSNQIRKLEETLGVVVFERSNKRVMPTETGEQIIALARRVLREVDAMHDVAQSAQDPLAGKFRLGAFPTLSTYVFPALVPKITAALPQLRLVLVEEKTQALLDRLKRGELDAALLALPVNDDQLAVKNLFDDEFFLAVPPQHPLAKKKTVEQSDLSNSKLLLLEEGHCLRDQALEVCHRVGMEEEQDFRATSLETLRQMVKAGTGITFMPQIAIQPDESGICYVPFKKPAPYRTIGLVWRKTTARMAVIEKLLPMLQ
jgi:LysR family transcriptional regulator, hydrogen peroxide-inducible genes activator